MGKVTFKGGSAKVKAEGHKVVYTPAATAHSRALTGGR